MGRVEISSSFKEWSINLLPVDWSEWSSSSGRWWDNGLLIREVSLVKSREFWKSGSMNKRDTVKEPVEDSKGSIS